MQTMACIKSFVRLFHFSDRDDIEVFVPRAPLRHPEVEPLVWAIDEAHIAMYLFPRDCPRISAWPLVQGPSAMRLLIDRRFETAWRNEPLVRYEFDPNAPIEATEVPGVVVCRESVRPIGRRLLTDLPMEIAALGLAVEVVDSLSLASREFYDPESRRFIEDWHVSMNRMSLLPDWDGEAGRPVV
jgi:hypothetical protein